MKENCKTTNYPSKNVATQTYQDGDTFVTKHYYDQKDAYVRELIYLKDGIKEIKHYTVNGVLAKMEHFAGDIRHGVEVKYFIPKANSSVKSSKTYENGKLHGESLTYNENDMIIKHEVFALGKLVLKYLPKDANNKINIQILDEENLVNLPKAEYEKLQLALQNN